MLKKLLASLLSVLCLFSIVGVNVSAAETKDWENITISGLAIFNGDVIPSSVYVKDQNGNAKDLPVLSEPNSSLSHHSLSCVFYGFAYREKGQNLGFGKVGDSLLLDNRMSKTYYIIIPVDSTTQIIGIDGLNLSEYSRDGFVDSYLVKDDEENIKIVQTEEEAKDYKYSAKVKVLTFQPKNNYNNITLKGFNFKAGEIVPTFETISYSNPNFSNIEFEYVDADNYDKGMSLEESSLTKGLDALELNKRYYLLINNININNRLNYVNDESFIKTDGAVLSRYNGSIDISTPEPLVQKSLTNESKGSINPKEEVFYYMGDFVTNETSQSVNLVYSIPEHYEWTITTSNNRVVPNGGIINLLSDYNREKQVEINVNVTEWTLNSDNSLKISVSSNNEWNMVQVGNEETKYPYVIQAIYPIDYDTKLWNYNPVLIEIKGTERFDGKTTISNRGIFSWYRDVPFAAGIYNDTLTFTAEIVGKEVAKVGDLIYLNRNSNYSFRVVKEYGDNKYELVKESATDFRTGDDFGNGIKMYETLPESKTEWLNNTRNGSYSYFNSDVDNYLRNTYYPSLPPEIQEAILDTRIVQNVYGPNSDRSNFSSYIYKDVVGQSNDRKVYILGLSDIEQYNKYGFEQFIVIAPKLSNGMWLRDSFNNNDTDNMLTFVNGNVSKEPHNRASIGIAPAFTIDLSSIDYHIQDRQS